MTTKNNGFLHYHLLSKVNDIMKREMKQKRLIKKRNNNTITKEYISRFYRTYSRSSIIYPFMKEHTIAIYNGQRFVPSFLKSKLIGLKLGEMSPTRNYTGHAKKKKGKRLAKKKK
ncbi:ribosomal protein S19 family protein [Paenibacillus sp. GCM10012307]|uniref:Small ribosomal subunit protein uS19 n=1 Tax=Paenibacillus roseus TaxID=2798579 RepID=A0A934MX31_9BACL|nr:ribosomal protein S19 family protein [Paenibacillus roseus]